MTQHEIRGLFDKNIQIEASPSMTLVTDIGKHVTVDLLIDEEGMEYYYSVKVIDLANSSIEKDTLVEMVDNGWYLSKDKKNILKKF